jgi:hypothetical protein
MSTTTEHGLSSIAEASEPLCYWETLCSWLTRDLAGIKATIARRLSDGEWGLECDSHPLDSMTTHKTPNGVRIISIGVRLDGRTKLFEVAGPNSLALHWNAAGWLVRVEFGYDEGELALIFSGQMDPQKQSTGNSWGE